MQRCLAKAEKGDIIIIAADCNASIGITTERPDNGTAPTGAYGIDYVNEAPTQPSHATPLSSILMAAASAMALAMEGPLAGAQ